MCDKRKCALLLALFLLPMSAVLLHLKVHPTITWLLPLALFDAIIITLLFYWDKTKTYGFWANTILGLVGIIFHLQTSVMGTMADNAIMLADMLVGYVLYVTVFEKRKKK
ncbi:MAG: hypothetical protein KJ697_03905 [Nanoarchaeota archaeon]|nr:hypothetical protein [Nanoarchaeota archaeon]MBU4072431.1 hypothetical protein [Candidatus Thermoplasmatota archaeon]